MAKRQTCRRPTVASKRFDRTVDNTDYKSFKQFYSANEDRYGDDVRIGEISGGELQWTITWLPRTSEVVAFAKGWSDPTYHARITNCESPHLTASDPPQLVCVLGRVESAADARTRLAAATSLDTVRVALALNAP